MSTRKLSDVQLEDSVVIDGGAVDTLMEDVVNYFNLVPPDADKSSWVQQQMSFGYTERRYDWLNQDGVPAPNTTWFVTGEPPFLPAAQQLANPENAYRMKGINTKGGGIDIRAQTLYGAGKYCQRGYIWQVSFWADAPMQITDLDMWFQTDDDFGSSLRPHSPYPDGWKWTNAGPVNTITAGDFVQDFVVQLEIDSPLNASNSGGTSVELQKAQFYADAQWTSFSKAWSSDMRPSMDDRKAWGVCVSAREINVPIAAKSRVRMNIFLPDWKSSNAVVTGDNRWLTNPYAPWRLCGYNGTLTWLERKV